MFFGLSCLVICNNNLQEMSKHSERARVESKGYVLNGMCDREAGTTCFQQSLSSPLVITMQIHMTSLDWRSCFCTSF